MRKRVIDQHGGLLLLFEHQPPRVVKAREALFLQGTPARDLYVVDRGRVRLLRHTATGHALTLHVAQGGELFAEGALFSETYHCDAIADEESSVRSLGKTQLIRHLSKSPALSLELLERVTHQLHRARALVELRAIRSAEERVLHHLLLSLPSGAREVVFRRPLTEVATEVGLTHEAYYRCLAKLTRNGSIERQGRRIRLHKRQVG
jgi:CRP/FNR family transcriptional regulator, dissimilatory nitrate respiration regulator